MRRRSAIHLIACIAIAFSVVVISVVAQQNVSEAYQRARMLDESNQNLTEAIRLYKLVITQAKGQRALVASAQYRLGVLYERLGQKADAHGAFKAIVSQYPDQTEVARHARVRLSAVGGYDKRAETPVIEQTGPSADGWYQTSFTSLTEQHFIHPVIDASARRLYTTTNSCYEPRNDFERELAQRQGHRYVYEPSSLIVIGTDRNSILKTVPLSVYIDEIAFNPANNKLYATAQVNGQVVVIDASNFARTRIDIRGQPTGIAVNPTTNKIYVSSQGFEGNDKLFVIDGATNAIAGPYDLGGVGGEVMVNSATNRVYAVASPKTRVFDGADNSVVTDLVGIQVVRIDPEHNHIYTTAGRGEMQVLDGNTHSVIATLGFSSRAFAIGIVPGLNRTYAIEEDKSQIVVIDTKTFTEMGRLIVAEGPHEIEVDPTTKNAYVCHRSSPPSSSAPMIGLLSVHSAEGDSPQEFLDEFDSPRIDPSWTVLSGQGSYSLTESPGHLRFHIAKPSGSKPQLLIMRNFRGNRWTLELNVSHLMGASGGSRSLIFGVTLGSMPVANAFGRSDNKRMSVNGVFVRRWRDDWDGCCQGQTSQQFIEAGKQASISDLPPNRADTYVWRIKRNNRTITIERSDDGITFALAGAHTFGAQIDGVTQYLGISFDTHSNNDAYADFDYVRLTAPTTNQH
jgi:YVTN family beta-propeller protein